MRLGSFSLGASSAVTGFTTVLQADQELLPGLDTEVIAPDSPPEERWHPAGYRRSFDYGEYADQQLVIGLLETGDDSFHVFLESGAGRVDYFIDPETGEIRQDQTRSNNMDYYNVVTEAAVEDGTLKLEAETRTDGTGGPIIDYPSTWYEIETASLSDVLLLEVTFTDRWDEQTTEQLPATAPDVDIAYHQREGVDYLLRDTAGWDETDRAISHTMATADARVESGLEIYVEVVAEQPTDEFVVDSVAVTDDGTLDLEMRLESDSAGEPTWTPLDKVVTVMNRGEIVAVSLDIDGGRNGPYSFDIPL